MAEWLIDLIIGVFSAILGFIGGFFTKTFSIKIKQKIKGNNNKQQIEDFKYEK